MKPFEAQKLESCGIFSKLFGSKPAENGWKELNNLLAAAQNMQEISQENVTGALKNGV